jgi:menaquinone-dependent protoporphyrinogen oxidase
MKFLIVVASRHGATRGIAQALSDELTHDGHVVTVCSTSEAPPVQDYDAVVVGSAVYFGKWLAEARHYLARNQQQLLRRPVWLFSSGPVGPADPQPKDDPSGIAQVIEQVNARGHRTFVGKLDPTQLGLGERFIIWNVSRLVRDAGKLGDFRDWEAIRVWADEISATLAPAAGAGTR